MPAEKFRNHRVMRQTGEGRLRIPRPHWHLPKGRVSVRLVVYRNDTSSIAELERELARRKAAVK